MGKNFIKIFFILFLILISISCFLFFIFSKISKGSIKKFFSGNIRLKKEKFSDVFFKTKQENFKIFFPKFSKEIQLFLHKARPDEVCNYFVEIFLIKGGKSRVFTTKEKIYLSYNGCYDFSDAATNFWLSLTILNEDRIKVEMFVDLSFTGKIEKESFFLAPIKKEKIFSDNKEIVSLKDAKWIGADLFLKLLENKDFENKQRLVFSSDKKKYQCFFSVGDLLIYKDGRWIEGNNYDTKKYSIAKIISFNENSLEIEYWEKDRLGEDKIVILKKNFSETFRIQDQFITDIRIRTKNQISCLLKNRRMVLREKDILLKKDNLWKKISLKNFKENLEEREFFIFDSLEKIGNGIIFKGYYFNKDRTNFYIIKKNIKVRKINNRRKR
ncbi:MAG: hypothetical protein AMS24_02105 [Chlamydiae bacterium SM23_39]|nr:MAG: hypothetical protein AMS24_02105 [Chlamydiae bacterium SM23_39]